MGYLNISYGCEVNLINHQRIREAISSKGVNEFIKYVAGIGAKNLC